MTILLPGVDVSRHLLGVTYVGAGATTGYGISGTAVATLIGTAVATLTLVLLILQNNRKTRREVAADMAAEKKRGRKEGRKEKDAEWRSWLNFALATGAIEIHGSASPSGLPSTIPPPKPPDEGDDDDDD